MLSYELVIVLVVTFILFFIEALLHFKVGLESGKNRLLQQKEHTIIDVFGMINIHVPDKEEFIEIVKVLSIFSILNAIVSNYLINLVPDPDCKYSINTAINTL